jgi:HK97 family phage prohead protease
MSGHGEAPLERAMVADGEGREYPRHATIRAMAPRLYAWRVAPESCQVCMAATALCVRAKVPLCFSCRELRLQSRDEIALLRHRLANDGDEVRGFDERHLGGYSIVYNARSVDLGGFFEIIRPEATVRTLRQGTDLLMLWNHDTSEPMGRLSAKARNLRVWSDDIGFVSALKPLSEARSRVQLIEEGIVKGQSFAFRAIEDDWHMDGETVIREVIDMSMSEVSAVTFPAYPQTDISLRVAEGRSIDFARRQLRAKLA